MKTITFRTIFAQICMLLLLSAVGSAQADALSFDTTPVLIINGEVPKPLELSLADLARLPVTKHNFVDQDGRADFEGVGLTTLLDSAGLKFGANLKGDLLATYLLVEAADGSNVVFSLPEIDSESTNRNALLAYRRDGQALADTEGPLRLVISDDSRKMRWVKRVKKLTLVRAKSVG